MTMRIVISDQNISDEKRINIILRALASLSFEANNKRGIMPEFWTKVTINHKGFTPTRGWYWTSIGISLSYVLDTFQWAVRYNKLDKYFPLQEGVM